jgi:hypothetical protein
VGDAKTVSGASVVTTRSSGTPPSARTYTAPVSDMTKPDAAANSAEQSTLPRTIQLASAAACTQVCFSLLYAALQWPLGDQLRRSVLKANGRKDKPSLLCDSHPGKGCLDVGKSVRSIQIQTTIGAILVAIAIALLLVRIRRGVRSARAFYIAVSVIGALVGFAGSPLSILAALAPGSVLLRLVSAVASVASVVAVVLLFLPESTKFFPRPERAGASGRGLFGPRPAPRQRPPRASGPFSSAASRGTARVTAKPTAAGARAKVRSEEAAVARGAQLARSRAKASKSRRTEL